MKRLVIIALFSIACFSAGATQQIHDKVIIDGETWELPLSPLQYLQPEMQDTFNALIGNRNFVSTANYRGYIAYWYVERNRLYLDRVEIPQMDGTRKTISYKDLKKVFRKFRRWGKIKAGWINGNLEVGYGLGRRDTSNPHISTFAKEESWVLKKGKIIRTSAK
ncbi:MAG: hypothetical protein II194_05900 [Bacteroidales bacterium]|nr:hypothetical protein [Bacteroidales bacterium]